jgi:hypothetical protein
VSLRGEGVRRLDVGRRLCIVGRRNFRTDGREVLGLEAEARGGS